MSSLSVDELLALQRTAFLLGPVLAAGSLIAWIKPTPREATAAMVAFLWQLPALLFVHLVAGAFGWWRFAPAANELCGLPVDVYLGWAIWWGPVLVLLNRWLPIWGLVAISVGVDWVSMSMLQPLVTLGPSWIVGDIAATVLCLWCGLFVGKLTREDRQPKRRAMFHVLGWGGYMLLVIPVCVLSYENKPLSALYNLPVGAGQWILAAAILVLLFIGIAATAEFARAGDGTPVPFDPPKRVVVTGPYAFSANPMQIISAAVMLFLALYAGSWGLGFVAAMFALFDSVYATWYNRAHIAQAMPDAWRDYRGVVDEWQMRWRPYVPHPAEVVISPNGPARWVWDRAWPGMSSHLAGTIAVLTAERPHFRRLVYRCRAAGIEDYGVAAAGRILEHGPAPLAMLGWLLRFPYLGGALQRLSWLIIVAWRRCANVPAATDARSNIR